MDLDAATDELYGLSPDDFVGRRTELVAGARAVKDRMLAKAIGQLRRPTRNGWLVNVLAREAPDQIEALLALGAELAAAQQRMAGDDLRRLSAQRRTSVDALAGEAIRLGGERGYAAPDSAHQDVSQSLQAALGDPEVAELVRRGRLVQAVTYGGFGLGGDLMAALAASTAAAAPAAPAAPATEPVPDVSTAEQERQEEQARQAAAEQAERERADREAKAERDRAEREAEEATNRADELADRVEELRTALREAEEAERVAREDARTARKRAAALRR